MGKKVALDILEIDAETPQAEEEAPAVDLPLDGPEREETAAPAPPERRRTPAWLRRPRLWLAALGLLVLAGAGLTLYALSGRPAPPPPAAPPVRADVAPPADTVISLTGFVIDLTDDRGQRRVLLCDAALMTKDPAAAVADWREARAVIHRTLKGQRFAALSSAEGRQSLKAKLREELNGLLGEAFVEAVYLTAFEIL